jgi:hypothetical protein
MTEKRKEERRGMAELALIAITAHKQKLFGLRDGVMERFIDEASRGDKRAETYLHWLRREFSLKSEPK